MSLVINDLETRRFGVIAAHLTDSMAAIDAVNDAAHALNVRMVTARVAANHLARVHELEADGYRLMDTLVYYSRGLGDLPAEPASTGPLSIRLATPEDAPAVASVAQAAFRAYFGHYHADPRLDDAAADAAYVEWAQVGVARQTTERPVLVATEGKCVIGFLTMRHNSEEVCEIVLNAVHPEMQSRGVYSHLVARSLEEARSVGAERIIVSTQIANARVQRVWARNGFVFDRALYTFHKWFD